jgi:hypothetical protein
MVLVDGLEAGQVLPSGSLARFKRVGWFRLSVGRVGWRPGWERG